MYWANFLHIYQPPTQTKRILERVVNEAYRRIIAELKAAPQAKLTLNITGGLSELLVENRYTDVIEDLKSLVKRGQVELTESAIYHPLLPRLPKEEIVRQIKLNHAKNKKYFGEVYKPKGFFPPEAAYDKSLASIVAELGYEWILAEELSYNGTFGSVKWDRVYEVEGINLKILFRERSPSFKILSGQLGTAKLFEDYLGERLDRDGYLLTAMDGETFGHHRPGMEKLLFELYRSPKIKTVIISQLLQLFPKAEVIETRAATWALMEKDVEKNLPFARWDDPENEIQKMQWELTELAIGVVKGSKYSVGATLVVAQNSGRGQAPTLQNNWHRIDKLQFVTREDNSINAVNPEKGGVGLWLKARYLLDKALHSDQYWWASARPWWSLEMIERGAKELMEVVLAVQDATAEQKERAKILYRDIIFTGFEWQRSGKVEEISRQEDEEIRERTDEGLPKLPKKEVEKMIKNIEQEMLKVAENREYERAAQLRDRIEELEEYISDAES